MAFLFDEVNDYIASGPGGSELLSLSASAWSISLWIKLTDNTGTAEQYIISKSNPGTNPSINWYIFESSHAVSSSRNEIAFQIYDTDTTTSGEIISVGQPFLSNTNWTHIALLRNGSIFTQYINGSADGTVTNSSIGGVNSTSTTFFGRRFNGDSDRYFGGAMAEFGHWNRLLSTVELTALKNGISPAFFQKNLQRYMPMIREYVDIKSDVNFVNVGTVVTSHPRIIYPSAPIIIHSVSPSPVREFSGNEEVSFDGSVELTGSTTAVFSGNEEISFDGVAPLNAYQYFAGSEGIDFDGIASFTGFKEFTDGDASISFDGDVTINKTDFFLGGEEVSFAGQVLLGENQRFQGNTEVNFDGSINLTGYGWIDVDSPFGPTWTNA